MWKRGLHSQSEHESSKFIIRCGQAGNPRCRNATLKYKLAISEALSHEQLDENRKLPCALGHRSFAYSSSKLNPWIGAD
jgi:hypothetical protein